MEPHEILDVRPGAGRREITDGFRRYALRHHPDRGGDPLAFQQGVEAYRQLTGAAGGTRRSRADVVFHRRRRPGVSSLLRLAGRRFAATLPRL